MQISSDLFSTHGRTCHINEKSTIILPVTPALHHWEGQGKLEQIVPWWRERSLLSLPVLRQKVMEKRVCFLPFLALLSFPRKTKKKCMKQKTGSKGKRRKETFWSEKDGISALEWLHDHHQFQMLEPEWVVSANLHNFTHLSHHKAAQQSSAT